MEQRVGLLAEVGLVAREVAPDTNAVVSWPTKPTSSSAAPGGICSIMASRVPPTTVGSVSSPRWSCQACATSESASVQAPAHSGVDGSSAPAGRPSGDGSTVSGTVSGRVVVWPGRVVVVGRGAASDPPLQAAAAGHRASAARPGARVRVRAIGPAWPNRASARDR